jgi:hypothetical protein
LHLLLMFITMIIVLILFLKKIWYRFSARCSSLALSSTGCGK